MMKIVRQTVTRWCVWSVQDRWLSRTDGRLPGSATLVQLLPFLPVSCSLIVCKLTPGFTEAEA